MRAATAKSELIGSILNLIPGRELDINPVKIQLSEDNSELALTGDLDFQWHILGIDGLKINVKQLNWNLINLENTITSNLILAGSVTISGCDCTATLTVTPEKRILVEIQQLENVSLDQITELFSPNVLVPDTVNQFLEQTNSPLKQVDVCYDPSTPDNLEITLIFEVGSMILPQIWAVNRFLSLSPALRMGFIR